MMKNTFHLILKTPFVIKMFKFGCHFGKQFDMNAKVSFKIHDAATYESDNHITKVGQLIANGVRNFFLSK